MVQWKEITSEHNIKKKKDLGNTKEVVKEFEECKNQKTIKSRNSKGTGFQMRRVTGKIYGKKYYMGEMMENLKESI